ncbi:MAG: PEP-CTERM sorting domain-containing protein [Verrucomicrobiae bacterium]|nr:PEP-CTERM sorting domain-containing protein [Verrucomicrobiae bacterium]NNJ43458.1 PEP-CTERM sorting domain-containing protein [Akkermansiaceae bacterium]
MKLLGIAAFAAQISVVSAISIQVNNDNGFDTNLVTDNTGALLTSGAGANVGTVAIGHFGGLSDAGITSLATTSVSNLVTSFSQVGSLVNFSATPDGFFVGSATADLTGGDSSAVGKGVFIVIGNSSSLAAATQMLVFRYEDDFVDTPFEGPGTASLINGTGTLLIGEYNNFGFDNDSNPSTPDAPAFNLVVIPIPEPSSTALLGLGGLAFFLRRRR